MQTLTVVAEQVLSPVPGGTGRYVSRLLAELPATAPPGWALRSVVARHHDLTAVETAGIGGPTVLPVDPRILSRLWQRGLPPWLAGSVVHAPTPLLPRRRQDSKLVVTVHDAVPFTHPETLTAHGAGWHRAMLQRAERTADAIIVPTAAVGEELSQFLKLGDRLVVIPMGATDLPVPPDAAERRRRLLVPDRYLVTLATVEPRKGLDLLIAAMGQPVADDVTVVVVGPAGWGAVDPVRLAAAAGVAPHRLVMTGRIDDLDLGAVMAGADGLVMPSRAEGFGLPVVEAMKAGVPVLHTDVPALVEVAGGASLMVPMGSVDDLAAALNSLWNDADLAADLRRRGRVRGGQFTWQRTAEQTWKVYTA